MDILMRERLIEELPLPFIVALKTNSRLLYVNACAAEFGFKQGQQLSCLIQEEGTAKALLEGHITQCRVALKPATDIFIADIDACEAEYEERPALAVTLSHIMGICQQSENDLVAAVCGIFSSGAKQPVPAFLRMTANYANAFYAALYEKRNGRYLIKSEWRARRSVCVPLLSADFDLHAEREMARLQQLKRAAFAMHVPYVKTHGTQGTVLYFFDNLADQSVNRGLEKCVALYKTFQQDKPQKANTRLIKRGLDSLAQGLAIWDADTMQILYENQAYRELFGSLNARMISEQQRDDLRSGMHRSSEYTDASGNSYGIAHAALRLGRQTVVTTLVSDVTKYKQAETRLEQMARTDALTGLLNRRAGIETLESIYGKCKAQRLPLTVCFADIDGLKRINDTCGHGAGDSMIRLAAGVLKRHVENKGFVCRLGGDEFVLILPGYTTDQARMLATRMEKAVAKNQINGGIAISFGFTEAAYSPDETADTLISVADSDMYREKRKKIR